MAGNYLTDLRGKAVSHERGFDLGHVIDVIADSETGELVALLVEVTNRQRASQFGEGKLTDAGLRVPARLVTEDGIGERIVVRG